MERYNYKEEICADVRAFLEENDIKINSETIGLEFKIHNLIIRDDSITGAESGSYFFNAWKAQEAVCHNLDLLESALEAFNEDKGFLLEQGAEAADVLIRCYLVDECLKKVLQEKKAEVEA